MDTGDVTNHDPAWLICWACGSMRRGLVDGCFDCSSRDGLHLIHTMTERRAALGGLGSDTSTARENLQRRVDEVIQQLPRWVVQLAPQVALPTRVLFFLQLAHWVSRPPSPSAFRSIHPALHSQNPADVLLRSQPCIGEGCLLGPAVRTRWP